MSIESLTSWKITKMEEKKFNFIGAGSPFIASWKTQDLLLKGHHIQGQLMNPKQGSLELCQATLKGNVEISISHEKKRSTLLKSAEIQYNAGQNQIILNYPYTFQSHDLQLKQKIYLAGSKCLLVLYNKSNGGLNQIKSGRSFGPITLKMESFKKDSQTKISLMGSADQLDFDNEKKVYIFTGNVKIKGNNSNFHGDIEAHKATITFNHKYEVQDMDFEGNLGKSTLTSGSKVN